VDNYRFNVDNLPHLGITAFPNGGFSGEYTPRNPSFSTSYFFLLPISPNNIPCLISVPDNPHLPVENNITEKFFPTLLWRMIRI